MDGVKAEHVTRKCVPHSTCTNDDWKETGQCTDRPDGKRDCEVCDYGDKGTKHDCISVASTGKYTDTLLMYIHVFIFIWILHCSN